MRLNNAQPGELTVETSAWVFGLLRLTRWEHRALIGLDLQEGNMKHRVKFAWRQAQPKHS